MFKIIIYFLECLSLISTPISFYIGYKTHTNSKKIDTILNQKMDLYQLNTEIEDITNNFEKFIDSVNVDSFSTDQNLKNDIRKFTYDLLFKYPNINSEIINRLENINILLTKPKEYVLSDNEIYSIEEDLIFIKNNLHKEVR